jgi:hypothetical protein
MSEHHTNKAKRIVNRYLSINRFTATTAQYRFLAREVLQRLIDKNPLKGYGDELKSE